MQTGLDISIDSRGARQGASEVNAALDSIPARARRAVDLVKRDFDSLKSAVFSLKGALAGLGLAFGVQELIQTTSAFERIKMGLTQATGSTVTARSEMEFLRRESNRLGLELRSTAEAYMGLANAAKGTSLAGANAREIFLGVSEAGTVLGLSAEQMSGALLAVQQMMSKGQVQAEELRGQLGERLPGAFQIAARAVGKTTAELGSMLEKGQVVADQFLPKFAAQLRKEFAGAAEAAAGSLQANINRMKNSWDELLLKFAEAGGLQIMTDAFTGLAQVLSSPQFVASMQQFSQFLAEVGSWLKDHAKDIALLGSFTAGAWAGGKVAAPVAAGLAATGVGSWAAPLAELTGIVGGGLYGLTSADEMLANNQRMSESIAVMRTEVTATADAYRNGGQSVEFWKQKLNDTKALLDQVRTMSAAEFDATYGGQDAQSGSKLSMTMPAQRLPGAGDVANLTITKLTGDPETNRRLFMAAGEELFKAYSDGFFEAQAKAPTDAKPAPTLQSSKSLDAMKQALATASFWTDAVGRVEGGASLKNLELEFQAGMKAEQADLANGSAAYQQYTSAIIEAEQAKQAINRTLALREVQSDAAYWEKMLSATKSGMKADGSDAKDWLKDANLNQKAFGAARDKGFVDGTAEYEAFIQAFKGAEQYREELEKLASSSDKYRSLSAALNGELANVHPTYETLKQQVDDWRQEQLLAIKDVVVGYDELAAKIDQVYAQKLQKAQADALASGRDFSSGAYRSIQRYVDTVNDSSKQAETLFTNSFQNMEDALVQFATTGELSFTKLVNGMIADMTRMFIQANVMAPIMSAFGFTTSFGSIFTGATKGVQVYPSAGAVGPFMSESPSLAQAHGGAWHEGLQYYAKGEAFTNKLFNSRTYFAHGGGLGVLGEAGAEGVFPLKRMSNGDLGVQAVGGGAAGGVTMVNNFRTEVKVDGGAGTGNNPSDTGKQIGEQVDRVLRAKFTEFLREQMRPGGALNQQQVY